MMRNKTTLFMMLLAAAMLLAGCQEPLGFNAKKGESIRVKVSSHKGISTKTAYSGNMYTEGNKTFERIDWLAEKDQIRIFSTNTDEVSTADGKAFFDYTIGTVSKNDPADRYSLATLMFPKNQEKYGLIWVNEPSATVTVYGIYPPMDEKGEEQDAVTNGGRLTGFVGLNIPKPVPASGEGAMLMWTASGNDLVGTPTEDYMKHAYMVSAPSYFKTSSDDPQWNGKPYVKLDFFPIFNAFYIELKGLDANEISLNSVSLSNEVESVTNPYSALTGDYRFNYKQRDGKDYPFDANGPTYESITQTGNKEHKVTVTFPAGTIISNAKSVKFTILTLPPDKMTEDGKTNLTNLVLTVNYGNNQTKSLRLNENVPTTNVTDDNKYGTPIAFPAFHKARITGLAMDGGENWKLEIDGDVLPWAGRDAIIDQQVSIQGKVAISGTIESTKAWQQKGGIDPDTGYYINAVGLGKDNHYADSEWTINGTAGYDKNYQIRTLNRDLPASERYFTMTFTPTAPTGGYWKLIPTFREGDNESYKHYRFEVILPGGDTSTQLTGQIINSEITIKIYPVDWDMSDMNTYDLWFTCYFSPSINFTPSISADSEFQDVHGDGRFSYWVFRLAQYSEHWIDE